MSMVQVEFSGAAEIERKMRRLSSRKVESVMRRALSAAARKIRDVARSRVPVKTGRLKKSIKVRRRRSIGNKLRVTVGSRERYSHLVEMGTRDRQWKGKGKTRRGKRSTGQMPGYHFLRNAYRQTQHEALEIFEKKAMQFIDEALR